MSLPLPRPAADARADTPLRTTALHDGPLVSIADWSCRGQDTGAGAEERASGHQLIIARSGVFATRRGPGGGEALVVGPAQALFQNAGDPYRVSHPVPGGDRCTVLRFSASALTETLAGFEPASRDRPDAPFRIGHAPIGPPVLLRLHRLRQRLRRGEASPLEAEEEAFEVLRGAAGDAYRARGTWSDARLPPPGTLAHRRRLVEATRLRVASRPGDAHSLTRLAREAGSSPFHLARIFRQETGLPIHRYLTRVRLALALARLEQGESNLSALALDLGFSSHGHFTAVFRSAFGAPPSRLRPRPRAHARLRSPRTKLEVR